MAALEVELPAEARRRFVRWDPALWQVVLARAPSGPLRDSYLRLCCEAVGLGYLYPGGAGFFNLAFLELVPALLPALPPPRQAEVLAALWNLGENLESAAPWLGRIFVRLCRALTSLDGLEAVVADVEQRALGAPAARGASIDLAAEDRRFLPGALHLVAPAVLCVHDRSGTGSLGIWLADPPLVLGPMGCSEAVTAASPDDEVYARCANAWIAASTLITSQRVRVVSPPP